MLRLSKADVYLAFTGRRVEDIIISRRGKGVKSTVKQAYASRGEPWYGSLCATRRTVVNDSLLQCPLKSLTTMARDKTTSLSPARASRVFAPAGACGEIVESERITPRSEDYSDARLFRQFSIWLNESAKNARENAIARWVARKKLQIMPHFLYNL